MCSQADIGYGLESQRWLLADWHPAWPVSIGSVGSGNGAASKIVVYQNSSANQPGGVALALLAVAKLRRQSRAKLWRNESDSAAAGGWRKSGRQEAKPSWRRSGNRKRRIKRGLKRNVLRTAKKHW